MQFLKISINAELGGHHQLHAAFLDAKPGSKEVLGDQIATADNVPDILRAALTALTIVRKSRIERVHVSDPGRVAFQFKPGEPTEMVLTTTGLRTRVQAMAAGLAGTASRDAFAAPPQATPIRAAVKPASTRRTTTGSASPMRTAVRARRPRTQG